MRDRHEWARKRLGVRRQLSTDVGVGCSIGRDMDHPEATDPARGVVPCMPVDTVMRDLSLRHKALPADQIRSN
jgi:hypothetical protein